MNILKFSSILYISSLFLKNRKTTIFYSFVYLFNLFTLGSKNTSEQIQWLVYNG